jgi:hypothetical protein
MSADDIWGKNMKRGKIKIRRRRRKRRKINLYKAVRPISNKKLNYLKHCIEKPR